MTVVAVLLTLFALQGAPFKATLTTAGHAPKVNARWAYSLKVRNNAGKPIAAKITVQTKDPLGGIHPIEFFNVKKNIVKYPIKKGVFRDAVTWPPESRGIPLTFRVIVFAAGKKRVLDYAVVPK
jgi:hypothetical protein